MREIERERIRVRGYYTTINEMKEIKQMKRQSHIITQYLSWILRGSFVCNLYRPSLPYQAHLERRNS